MRDNLVTEVYSAVADSFACRAMNHSAANMSVADEFLAALDSAVSAGAPGRSNLCILDVGTGTARIPVEVCTRRSGIRFIAVDRAARALKKAQSNIRQAGLTHAIRPVLADAGALPCTDAVFDAVISNGLMHHLHSPVSALCEMVRVLRPGGVLLVRDTAPQPDVARIRGVLARSAGDARTDRSPVRSGLLPGALSLSRVRNLLCAAGLPPGWARQTGSRHWTIEGTI